MTQDRGSLKAGGRTGRHPAAARIIRDVFSPIMIDGALVLPEVKVGMIDASATRSPGATHQRSLQAFRPTLPPMHHSKHLDGIFVQTIRGDIRCPADNQFPRACSPAWPSDLRKLQQPGDRRENPLHLPLRRCRIVVCDVVPRGGEIAQRRRSPDYSHDGMGSSSGRPQD